ncbi:MAG: glycosyl hydrolase family 65 protein [Planctomycetota bacterium]
MKENGFIDDGRRYVLRDINGIDRADAGLWNDRFGVQIDHRGRLSQCQFVEQNRGAYSDPPRWFYVRDDVTGRFWSAPHDPVQVPPDSFEFSAGLGDVRWAVTTDGIRVDLRLVIPRDDDVELWTATVTNVSKKRRTISLFSFLSVGSRGAMTQHAFFDPSLGGAVHKTAPYYLRYQDYYTLRERNFDIVCLPDVPPKAWEFSVADFAGRRGLHDPAQLKQRRLRSSTRVFETANEDSANIFQFAAGLAPGRSKTVNFVFGPAKDRAAMRRLKRTYLREGGIDAALKKVYRFIDASAPQVRVETPDAELNHFVNHWLPRRTQVMARTARFRLCAQGRNMIQDAMGAVYVDPDTARDRFARIWRGQHTDGWLPHGVLLRDDAEVWGISTIPHRDTNVWGPICLAFYVYETGDVSILDETVPFGNDKRKRAALYDHICLGLEWLLKDRTKRGLSRIGQGDWSDPLNMAGMKGRGESVWLSEALAFALDAWAEIAELRGDGSRAARYRREARKLTERIRALAWDGRWYARGFTDAGRPFGVRADREGRIFLNAQSWALLCGAAGPKRAESCIRSVEAMLMTPAGPTTLAPAFTHMHEDIGKLTQKAPGWNENGSVYCHAAVFYAYALYRARENDRAFDVLRRLLPGARGNTIRRTGQLPLYIPNFYRGPDAGKNAGLSSHGANTGTAPWYYRTVVSMLLGVRAEAGGLRIDPQLPSRWKRAKVWRRWRGAEFEIEIRRAKGKAPLAVWLDGTLLDDNLIPVQKKGTLHKVTVRAPGGDPTRPGPFDK